MQFISHGHVLSHDHVNVYLSFRESVTPLSLLADMTAQAKAIEILISHVHDVSSLLCTLSMYKVHVLGGSL